MNRLLMPAVLAYIDPGTGSMLFTILFGLISVFLYSFKGLLIKLKNSFGIRNVNKDHSKYTIYTDSKRYWSLFKPILEEFENREIDIDYLTQSEDDDVFKCDYRYVHPRYIGNSNKAFASLNLINSDILLSTTPSLDVFQWKRSKQCKYYIHIPHACSDLTLYRLFGIDYYDAILCSGAFQIDQVRELEKLRNLPAKDMQIVGLTYFDELAKRLKNNKRTNKEKTVLVAPTWGPNSLLNLYGDKIINALIKTGYKIIIRPHPQSFSVEKDMIDRIINKYPDIEINSDSDNFDVLNNSDILISDYSGVIFDFALVFNKPIIYADISFDDSYYDSHWLDIEPWTFNTLEKIGAKLKEEDLDNIKQLIDNCMTDEKYEKARKQAVKQAWANKGKAAKLIADYMIEKQKELTKEDDRQ